MAEGGHSFLSNTVGHQVLVPEGEVITTEHNVIPPMDHTGLVRLTSVGGNVQDHTIRVPGSLHAMLQKIPRRNRRYTRRTRRKRYTRRRKY